MPIRGSSYTCKQKRIIVFSLYLKKAGLVSRNFWNMAFKILNNSSLYRFLLKKTFTSYYYQPIGSFVWSDVQEREYCQRLLAETSFISVELSSKTFIALENLKKIFPLSPSQPLKHTMTTHVSDSVAAFSRLAPSSSSFFYDSFAHLAA